MAHLGPEGSFGRKAQKVYRWWLKNDSYQRFIIKHLEGPKNRVRAGQDPCGILAPKLKYSYVFTDGWEIFRRGYKGPLFLMIMANVGIYARLRYDEKWVWKRMNECQHYREFYYLVGRVEWIKPGFRDDLFQKYEDWVFHASENPDEFIQKCEETNGELLRRFETLGDWIEKLKYDLDRELVMKAKKGDPQALEEILATLPGYNAPLPDLETTQKTSMRYVSSDLDEKKE